LEFGFVIIPIPGIDALAPRNLEKILSNLPSTPSPKQSLVRVSPLQLFLQEISKYPLLTPQEEYELAVQHFNDGNIGAAHRLVTSNLRLVVKIANEFRQAQVNLLDLIQEGNYGLMQAVKRFNPYKGVKLSSYAAWWIRAYILKYLMDNRSQVKIGTTAAQRKLYYNLKKETERLLSEYETVDPKLLADNLDVKEREVVEMQQRLSAPDLSIDAPINGNEGNSHGSLIADESASAEDVYATLEIKRIFEDHLAEFEKTISGRDLDIFRERLMNDEPKTLQEIGDQYGITRERARQIEQRIVNRLKDFVASKGKLIDI
jgi:RNA polymerase sigma-32 factor